MPDLLLTRETRGRRVAITGGLIVEDDDSVAAVQLDCLGLTLFSGYVDLQINGGFGFDIGSDPTSMWEIGARLPAHGVTAFLPTVVSSPRSATEAAIEALKRRPEGYAGAEPLGLHLEGPMLNPNRAGAHPRKCLQAPSLEIIASWTAASGVLLVTLAPELSGASEVIKPLVDAGVVVSMGHTDADAANAAWAVDEGASMATHLFNAMSPLGHRAPNLVGQVLTDERIVAGLIVDGVHVDPSVVALTWLAKGPGGLALVTDAVAAMAQPAGVHCFAAGEVVADRTSVRLSDGTLAGSILTMDQAVRNLVAFSKCSLDDSARAASATPARVLGLVDRGSLQIGKVADVVALDAAGHVVATVCAGHVCHLAVGEEHRLQPGDATS